MRCCLSEPTPANSSSRTTPVRGALLVATLGVVYGDIGTSPLYALRECFAGVHSVRPSPENVLGLLSLTFWALILVISVKYVAFVMRADNRGEAGILALTALVRPVRASAGDRRTVLVLLGLFGAALLYGDGMITPAISVLSAVEALAVATPVFSPYVVPITLAVLIGLFLLQRRGTAGVGALFGPSCCCGSWASARWAVRRGAPAARTRQGQRPTLRVRMLDSAGVAGLILEHACGERVPAAPCRRRSG